MRWTDLRTGYRCNHTCRFCNQGALRDTSGDASTADLIAAMVAIPHREGLVLAGGEVTLRADLLQLLAHARTLGFQRLGVQSNGSVLAAPPAAAALRAAGLTDVVLALHAPTADVHDWLTQRPGSYKRAVATARNTVAAGLTLRINTVLTRTGAPLLPDTVSLAGLLHARSLRAIVAHEVGSAVPNARMLLPRWELVVAPLRAAWERARNTHIELEAFGLPPCVAPDLRPLLGDRLDVAQPERATALPGQAVAAPVWPAPCAHCTLRPICPGLHPAYVARWGTDELRPAGPQPSPKTHHDLTRMPGDSSRTLRQQLVRLQAAGIRSVRIIGTRDDNELQGLFRECDRLGIVASAGS